MSRLRLQRGLTQEQLAEMADIDVRYLVRIQRATERASLDVLVALAEALGVQPDRLLRPASVERARAGRPSKSDRARPARR